MACWLGFAGVASADDQWNVATVTGSGGMAPPGGPAGGCSLPEQAASRRVAERVDRPRPARRVAERTVTMISGGWISDGAWGIVYTNTVVCKYSGA